MARKKKATYEMTCENNEYRWRYDMSLIKNPTILIMIWKIFGFICLGIFLFSQLMSINSSIYGVKDFLNNTKYFAIFTGGMMVLCLLGYLLYAALMGGKYCVEFTMDENGVLHKQIATQAKKAKKIGMATAAAGALSGRPSTISAGVMSASRTSMRTEFYKVKKIKVYKRRNVIKVNAPFNKNQVYVRDEDFDFVCDYICARCPSAKVTGRK